MQCPNCGAELKPGAKFCAKCGATVSAPASTPCPGSTRTNPHTTHPTKPAPSHVAPAPASMPARPVAVPPAQRGYYHYSVVDCRKYFANKSIAKYIAYAVVALILCLVTSPFMPLAILFLIVALAEFFVAYMVRGTMNEAQIMNIYSDISETTRCEAAQKMGLTHEDQSLAQSFSFEAPSFSDVPCTCFARTGSDNVIRTSNYQVTVLYAGAEALHCYTVNQSLTLQARTPRMSEIFYEEVVRMRIVEPEMASGTADASFFELELRSGRSYLVYYVPSQRESVLALRTLLRDKKAESDRIAQAQLEALKSL